jgi:uncharacterized membrane protein YeaQ/YmgE (transglycosylase-associated protein family)
MLVLLWIAAGLIVGLIASKIANRPRGAMFLDQVIAIVGATVGGWLTAKLGNRSIDTFDFHSLLSAVVGSIVLLLAYATRRTPID